jgi:hypothetical protein
MIEDRDKTNRDFEGWWKEALMPHTAVKEIARSAWFAETNCEEPAFKIMTPKSSEEITQGPWEVTYNEDPLSLPNTLRLVSAAKGCIDVHGLPLTVCMNQANAHFIVTACNACMKRDPANPQRVADLLAAL